MLTYLRHIADASTITAYNDAVHAFKDSSVWKSHRRLQQWFSKTWQPEHKVHLFFCQLAIFNPNLTVYPNTTFNRTSIATIVYNIVSTVAILW